MNDIEIIKETLNKYGFHWLAENYVLIFLAIVIISTIWKISSKIADFIKQRKLRSGLNPTFFTPFDIKNATRYYIKTKCQNVDPSRENEPGQTHAFAVKEKLIPFFMKKAFDLNNTNQKYFFILSDSGMGKTTFMINLYAQYRSKLFGKKYDIVLMPLASQYIDKELESIKEKEKTILLLDAFDEDSKALIDYRRRLDELLEKTFRFPIIIFTCRTQFFSSAKDEPYEVGIIKYYGEKGWHHFKKLYISPFDNNDIKKFLNKKYSILNFIKKKKALKIVNQSQLLMVRPMLLNYIDDLIKTERDFNYTYEVYEELINKWVIREGNLFPAKEEREKFIKELYVFSNAVAVDIYRNRINRKGLYIDGNDIMIFAKQYNINLKDIEMKSHSLLNRNNENQYKFSHKSILEFFIATEAFKNDLFAKELQFDDMQQAETFCNEIVSIYLSRSFLRYTSSIIEFETFSGEIYGPVNLKYGHLNQIKSARFEYVIHVDLVTISKMKNLEKLDFKYCTFSSFKDLDLPKLKYVTWQDDYENRQNIEFFRRLQKNKATSN